MPYNFIKFIDIVDKTVPKAARLMQTDIVKAETKKGGLGTRLKLVRDNLNLTIEILGWL